MYIWSALKFLEEKNHVIEKQKSEFLANVNYAQKIQQLYIPGNESGYEPGECFSFFQPRDVVGGDFFWLKKLNDQERLFVLADCTGHGVPGAFVSIVGFNGLKRTINEFKLRQPGKILDKLTEIIAHHHQKMI